MERVEADQIELADVAGAGRFLEQVEKAQRAEMLLKRAIVAALASAAGPGRAAGNERVLRAVAPDQRLGEEPHELGFAAPLGAGQDHEWISLERNIIGDGEGVRESVAGRGKGIADPRQHLLLAAGAPFDIATRQT